MCDRIDERHQAILPPHVWGDGDPEGVRQRAADEMGRAAEAARAFGVDVVNGFTGSSIWHSIYAFPPTGQDYWDAGFRDFAERWTPIMDTFAKHDVRFALEVHPTEIAFDIASAERALEAIGGHPQFGFNFDPSHLAYQGVDYVAFIRRFADRIFHAHMKDVWWGHGDGRVGIVRRPHELRRRAPRAGTSARSAAATCNFEEIIVALNDIGYEGPLSIEWEDSRMDRVHGATESAAFVKRLDFAPSNVAFDAAFDRGRAVTRGRSRYGMVGGGRNAFIGAVHRAAAALDQQAVLTAGALSSDPDAAPASRRAISASPTSARTARGRRCSSGELARPADDRIDFVVIVTPNDVHFPVAKAAVEAGFHVVCDKPLVHTSRAGRASWSTWCARAGRRVRRDLQLHRLPARPARARHGRERRARRAAQGRRPVQPGLARDAARGDRQQAGRVAHGPGALAASPARWATSARTPRTSPRRSPAGTSRSVSADLATVVPGRLLDDDAAVLLRLDGGVRGLLVASQIEIGNENNLRIRVHGSEGSLALAPGGSEPARARAGERPEPATCGAATTTCRSRRRRRRASRRATRRATSRRSPTSTSACSRRSARSRRDASSARSRASSRRSRTARAACASSSA